jgi:hypothetical protein
MAKIVVPLRLTAAIATTRIRKAALKPGTIVLSDELRQRMAEIDLLHPELADFLLTARVVEEPQLREDLASGWRCRLEGKVIAAQRGLIARLTLWNDKIYVEGVEWA